MLLFWAVISACSQPRSKPPFIEEFIRTDSIVILKKLVNNRQIEIVNISDSLLLFSQENTKTDTILEYFYLYAFNDTMDLNADSYKDLVIYNHPNMHGQCMPVVFLSNKGGKLCYRPDLSLMNIQYDTISKHILSFYVGGVYTRNTKDCYTWEGDSLRFHRGASFELLSPMGETLMEFYEGNDTIPYKTLKNCCEELWDTAVFKGLPDVSFYTEIQ
ncbi:hypothetical protein SAMN05428949_5464 [Chitinophaga sp. YR627]|nr:hypothetical protein SAMN05428949_5464 [Chitinophaga sp. YR627]